ncbi:MAG: hypothetical protein M3P08_19810 [Thermoproteota archaeon]|nr:hypothetical protein [Thermoproteota archaeon]
MTSKPNWACATCGMFSSRKASVKRHIVNIHDGHGVLLSYIDYIIGRKIGFYQPSASPNFINKPERELVLAPRKLYDVFQEEVCREAAREALRRGKKYP